LFRTTDLRVNSYELRPAFDAYLRRRGPSSPVKTLSDLIATGKYLKGGSQELRFRETMKVGPLDTDAGYLSRLELQRTIRSLLVEIMAHTRLTRLCIPLKLCRRLCWATPTMARETTPSAQPLDCLLSCFQPV